MGYMLPTGIFRIEFSQTQPPTDYRSAVTAQNPIYSRMVYLSITLFFLRKMVAPEGLERQRPTVFDLPIMRSSERAEPG